MSDDSVMSDDSMNRTEDRSCESRTPSDSVLNSNEDIGNESTITLHPNDDKPACHPDANPLTRVQGIHEDITETWPTAFDDKNKRQQYINICELTGSITKANRVFKCADETSVAARRSNPLFADEVLDAINKGRQNKVNDLGMRLGEHVDAILNQNESINEDGTITSTMEPKEMVSLAITFEKLVGSNKGIQIHAIQGVKQSTQGTEDIPKDKLDSIAQVLQIKFNGSEHEPDIWQSMQENSNDKQPA